MEAWNSIFIRKVDYAIGSCLMICFNGPFAIILDRIDSKFYLLNWFWLQSWLKSQTGRQEKEIERLRESFWPPLPIRKRLILVNFSEFPFYSGPFLCGMSFYDHNSPFNVEIRISFIMIMHHIIAVSLYFYYKIL